jgi:phosphomethylpyrimidine synthase
MNKPRNQAEFPTPEVTTGPLPGSSRVYTHPKAAPHLAVPHREIELHPTAMEPPVRVYDTSGPYTDPAQTIDVEKGLPQTRKAWVLARGGVEEYEGRETPLDNGGATGKYLAREFPVRTSRCAPRARPRSPSWNSPAPASSPTK